MDGRDPAQNAWHWQAARRHINEVDPAFSGHVSLRYKTGIPEAVLTTIPRRSLRFAVPREWVLRAVGVPAPRPA
jgi:hypothetical protein